MFRAITEGPVDVTVRVRHGPHGQRPHFALQLGETASGGQQSESVRPRRHRLRRAAEPCRPGRGQRLPALRLRLRLRPSLLLLSSSASSAPPSGFWPSGPRPPSIVCCPRTRILAFGCRTACLHLLLLRSLPNVWSHALFTCRFHVPGPPQDKQNAT